MARKKNKEQDNELEKIRDKLQTLNQKVKKYASSNLSSIKSKKAVSRVSQALPGDISLEKMRNKLHAINAYLKQRLFDGKGKEAVEEMDIAGESVSLPVETNKNSQQNDFDEKIALRLPQVDVLEGKGTLSRLGVGLDLGTAYLVASREVEQKQVIVRNERNAFLTVRDDNKTYELLDKLKIKYASMDGKLYVLGNRSLKLADMLNREVHRSMRMGILNPSEVQSIPILKLIIQRLLWLPREEGEVCCFSIPANPVDYKQDTIYHRGIFEEMLTGLGFEAIIIDEGYAVILAELAYKDFTGIGISCGGGMVNVCAAFKSVPVLSFSLTRGGDWIDQGAAASLGIPVAKVTMMKEQGVDLKNPRSREEEAIVIYYKNYIRYFLENIAHVFKDNIDAPQFNEPVDIVFAGGSSIVTHFLDVVKEELQSIEFGLPLGAIKRAEEPFTSVSRGCLFHAINSDKHNY